MVFAADMSDGGDSVTTTSGEGTAIITDPVTSNTLVETARQTGNTNSGDFIPDTSGDFTATNVESGGDNALGATVTAPSTTNSQMSEGANQSGSTATEPTSVTGALPSINDLGGSVPGGAVGLGVAAVAAVVLLGR